MAIVVLLLQADDLRSPQAALVNNFISGWLGYLRQTNLATRREVSQVQLGNTTEPILDMDVSPTEAAIFITSNIVMGKINIHLWLEVINNGSYLFFSHPHPSGYQLL